MKKVKDFNKNEEEINKIYKSLIDRYQKEIKKYNIVTEYNIIKKLNDLLKDVLKAFSKGCEELRSLEYFSTLNNITFTDTDSDKKIIEKATNNGNYANFKIYIKTNDFQNKYEKHSFFCVLNGVIYQINPHGGPVYIIKSDENLNDNYMTLENFLDHSKKIGEYALKNSWTMFIAYKMDELYLYYQTKKFYLSRDEEYRIFENQEKTDIEEILENPQEIYIKIREQLIKQLETALKNKNVLYKNNKYTSSQYDENEGHDDKPVKKGKR